MSDPTPEVTAAPQGPFSPSALVPGKAAPPHPLDGEWHVHTDGQVFGPYNGHLLAEYVQEGRISSATQVVAIGEKNWVRAADEPRLASLFRKPPNAPPPISAAAGATVVQITNQIMPTPMLMMEDGMPFGAKSPGVALLLSFLLCGGGQMYCGRVGKGFMMFFGSLLLWGVMLGWIISIWSMVDAYRTAKRMNLRFLQHMQAYRLS